MNSLNSNTPDKNNLISDDDIGLVKDIPITEVIEIYLPLTKNGAGYKALCPFHTEKTPSFNVTPSKNIFKCFGCGEAGDAIAFVEKYKQLTYPEAIKEIGRNHGIEIHEEELSEEASTNHKRKEALYNVNQWAGKWFASQLQLPEYAIALEYVKSRWNDESIDDFNLGFAPDGWDNLLTAARKGGYKEDLLLEAGLINKKEKNGKAHYFDTFRDRIIFPISDRHGIAGFTSRCMPGKSQEPKYLNTADNLVYHKSNILYNLPAASRFIKQQANAYLVEGNADVIRLHQNRICNCVAISGTSLTAGHIEALKKITPCITLIGDTDKAGQDSVSRSAKMIIESGMYCKIITLPDGEEKQDADSFFKDKATFDEYDVAPHKKDYILYLAEKKKNNHQEPDQKAKLISEITSLVLLLPDDSQEHYFAELGMIVPPKTGWKGKVIKNISGEIKKKQDHERGKNPANISGSDEKRLKEIHDFYFVCKDRDSQFKEIKVDRVKFIDKLKVMGFLRFDTGIDTCRFVMANNNTLKEVSSTIITDHFIDFVENIEAYQQVWEGGSKLIDSILLKRKMYDGIDTYFATALLKRLKPDKPIRIKRDTRNEKFLFYQNGFVSVTDEGFSFHNYNELDSFIWSNQMLNRDFKDDFNYKDSPSVFQKFIWNICNKDEDRQMAMQTIIGYALHNYMECKLWAIILTDSRISQDGEPNGRTGKTLWGKALGHMLNTDELGSVFKEINGKDFQPKNKFKFEEANLDTQLIHLNDIYNNYNIESSFNDITEGIKVDKKNDKPINIHPKFIFSTNKTIIIEGESAKDRVIQFEFADHYNSDFSPEKEFGSYNENGTFMPHRLFTDWDNDEWLRFDYFMISCINQYFKHGIIRPVEINLSTRTLIDHTAQEFLNFMEDARKESGITYDINENGVSTKVEFSIQKGVKFSKKTAYALFIKMNNDFNGKHFPQRKFTSWMRMYAKYNKFNLQEPRSDGSDYFILEW